MATVIRSWRDGSLRVPKHVMDMLPFRLGDEIRALRGVGNIEEIRLRSGRVASLTADGKNLPLQTVLTRDELDRTVSLMCGGSMYAHRDAISAGYLSLDGGVRVGICGRASVDGGKIIGVYDISGLNIRIPRSFGKLGAPVCRALRDMSGLSGILIYAPPGVGKTTLLRGVIAQMASGEKPVRVSVIDTRGELGFSLEDSSLCVDMLIGYPRKTGIEIATRTMNAQLIVCDEIGEESEAEAIIASQNCGVPFLASAHADSVEGLLRRSGIYKLHKARVFGAYVGIRRRCSGADFDYSFTSWEEAENVLKASGSLGSADKRSGIFI